MTYLYSKKDKLLLFFTPKAACSFGAKWFFYQVGLYDESVNFDSWVHNYRIKIYDKKYQSNIDKSIYDSNIIFLVRNPIYRTVSSYIHGLKHGIEKDKISKFLNRNLDNEKYSFNEFVQYLKTINLKTCNPHYKIQSNIYFNDKKIIKKNIIKSENIIENFKQLEVSLGLKESPLETISDSLSFHRIKTTDESSENCFDKRYSIEELNEKIPGYKYFYNDKLLNDVYTLFKSDFENCYYKPEI